MLNGYLALDSVSPHAYKMVRHAEAKNFLPVEVLQGVPPGLGPEAKFRIPSQFSTRNVITGLDQVFAAGAKEFWTLVIATGPLVQPRALPIPNATWQIRLLARIKQVQSDTAIKPEALGATFTLEITSAWPVDLK